MKVLASRSQCLWGMAFFGSCSAALYWLAPHDRLIASLLARPWAHTIWILLVFGAVLLAITFTALLLRTTVRSNVEADQVRR